MTPSALDWSIVALFVALLIATAWFANSLGRGVAGFLSADRCAGRYLVSVAYNMAQVGVITLVWYFQLGYDVGFTQIWWGYMEGPSLILLAITGWVIYRFRETRAMTLAQFFELRYSKRFRILSGIVAFISGIINYGIFPGVTARFFIALCGLPDEFPLLGASIPTFPTVMVFLLALGIFMIFAGGMVSIILTDFLQGVFCFGTFVFICFWLLAQFPWPVLERAMLAMPEGTSCLDPLGLKDEKNFGIIYWAISAFILFYAARAWQGDQGYNSAPLNAHEARMAQILNGWRYRVLMLVTIIVPLAVRAFLTQPEYADAAAPVNDALAQISNESLRSELRTPLALSLMLPAGIMGLFIAAMLGAAVSTDEAYLHSWGSIFIQDVILPFRKRHFEPRTHIRLLKLSALGVAIFAFMFSLLYKPNQYIAMFASITATVFVGGAGAAIIGGLYWRRGSTQAAWGAMLTGIVLAALGVIVYQLDEEAMARESAGSGLLAATAATALWLRTTFTGQEMSFIGMMSACIVYVGVSLLGPRTDFDLDRMLHRRRWRVEGDPEIDKVPTTIAEKLGIDCQFKGWDKVVTLVTLAWPLVFTGVFLVGTGYAIWRRSTGDPISSQSWSTWWFWWMWLILGTSVVIVVWFTIGGIRDVIRMIRILRSRAIDNRDDGMVVADEPRRQ
ncbi:MAG: sodium:solute symporter [Phycisphaerales bacterium]|nr:sodium:solute symporter [Phycisphaerales bacterium]